MTDRRDNEPKHVIQTDSNGVEVRISSRTMQKSAGGRAILVLLALDNMIALTTKDDKTMTFRWEDDPDA